MAGVLGNMLPTSSQGNTSGMYIADSKADANFDIAYSCISKATNFLNLLCRELGHAVSLAKMWCVDAAVLLVHIMHVISMGAYKKMCWITTGRIVTLMTDEHSFRDWSMCEFPCNTVGTM